MKGELTIRIDKFLKNSRIIKRRTVAKKACDQGKVLINGKVSKPGDEVNIADIITVNIGSGSKSFEVLDLKDNVKKKGAADLYRIIEE